MSELHLPWLEAMLLCPLIGAGCAARFRDSIAARKWCVWFSAMTLVCALGAWIDFQFLNTDMADDRGHLLAPLLGEKALVIDHLSAPLLPLVALLYFLTTIATLRTKIRRFSFPLNLVSEAVVLATLSCDLPWGIIGLLGAGTVLPYLELRARGKPTRVYCLHMGLFVALLIVGQLLVDQEGVGQVHSFWAIAPLVIAVLIRSGIFPLHCWVADLFEQTTFGAALLFVAPMLGAYAAVRLVLPIAPDEILQMISLLALATAFYASGMALIQREARRFFCYLFLSNSALVLLGLDSATANGLTGGLCVWLSIGLSLGGLGLTLRALEGRRGRLYMRDFQGLYEHTPNLAMCFGLTGLASVGFPGTFGFVGAELLVDGAVETHPFVGITVVVVAALNGIAIVQAFFRLFAGTRYISSVSLKIRNRERYAVLALAALILLGGFFPQRIVASRNRAAEELLHQRGALAPSDAVEEARRNGWWGRRDAMRNDSDS